MEESKKPARRALKLVLLIGVLLACILPCQAYYAIHLRPNNERHATYQLGFQTIPHPPDTERLNTFGEVGWMVFPFREECNFLVGEQRSYSGTQNEIKEFYAGYDLDQISEYPYFLVTQPDQYPSDLHLLFSDDEIFAQSCSKYERSWSLVRVCGWVKRNNLPDSYMIYYTTRGDPPGYDYRCNFIGW